MKRNVYLKIVGIAILAGWVCAQTASAQEVQGKVINDYAKLLGETFTEQEKVDAKLNGQRTALSEEMKKYSEAVDGSQTRVSEGRMVKVFSWFDNEWAYANRLLDVAKAWLELASERTLDEAR